MKYASDFRRIAREALSGRWTIAVITGVVASLLGAASSGPELNFEANESGADLGIQIGDTEIISLPEGLSEEVLGLLARGVGFILVAGLILGIAFFILGSIIRLGYSRFNLDLIDRQKEPEFVTLFGYFRHWKNASLTALLKGLYIFLWSLLLVIPGILAVYSYAMTDYILAEHPEMEPSEALARSKEMMYGNRWRLFCLEFSFFGWALLSALTLGIGSLWLNPYTNAATTAFYREVSGTWHTVQAPVVDAPCEE